MVPNHEKKRDNYVNPFVIPIERWTSILKMVERDVSYLKPKHQYHLPQQGECVIVPNHEKKWDYYMNPYLSQLKDKLQF